MAGWCEEAVALLLRRPALAEMAVDVLLCAVPIWAAIMIGLVVGWSWRPRWTGLLFLGLRSRLRILWIWVPPGLGARRLWLAFTALSACSVAPRLLSSAFCRRRHRGKHQDKASHEDRASAAPDGGGCADGRTIFEGKHDTVTEKDLEHLLQLLDNKESWDTAWQNLMERTTSNMTYKAWWREPEFPFFCSDREYIFGGRIWESGKTYYCVTKAVPYPSLPKKEKPRRVELYFSSWRIRAVQSPKHVGQQSACEVTLVHYEDMGIPKDVARVAVRHGMWGAVKKLQSGFRAYQQMRGTENTLSHSTIMARVTTKISITDSNGPLDHDLSVTDETSDEDDRSQAVQHGFDWKWVVVGGAVAAVCVLNTGLVGKVLLLGAARRQAKK
ncbi:uncharacterized protein [Miscanthus floridulus]|uniref:uncharacterized protein isoform X3 n=1 Tax=Miscanthus floridulus TaxID=154761 RepID=UPI0034585728